MKNGLGIVIENIALTERVFQMKVKIEDMDANSNVVPGQFYYLQVQQSTAPLLRRPISLHDVSMEKRSHLCLSSGR
ncbi:hypothetical protein [Tepidibacillus marianensis]|uniref:hypothetical protein n=1 Tax=Tepidibacillus marianensis TaxID=3131995 RepID=UPI0030CE7839